MSVGERESSRHGCKDRKARLKNKENLLGFIALRLTAMFVSFLNYLLIVISIVETMRLFVSPSRGGISAVPMAIFVTLRSFTKRFRAISATSTAVVIAWPRAFKVISFVVPAGDYCQHVAHWWFVSDEDYVCVFSHFFSSMSFV
jgi:hypothetical protein